MKYLLILLVLFLIPITSGQIDITQTERESDSVINLQLPPAPIPFSNESFNQSATDALYLRLDGSNDQDISNPYVFPQQMNFTEDVFIDVLSGRKLSFDVGGVEAGFIDFVDFGSVMRVGGNSWSFISPVAFSGLVSSSSNFTFTSTSSFLNFLSANDISFHAISPDILEMRGNLNMTNGGIWIGDLMLRCLGDGRDWCEFYNNVLGRVQTISPGATVPYEWNNPVWINKNLGYIGFASNATSLSTPVNISANDTDWMFESDREEIHTTPLAKFEHDIFPQSYLTWPDGDFRFNFYDDGSEIFLNMTDVMDAFNIETQNSKLILWNEPSAAQDFKVLQVFSKEAQDITEFVVTKAGKAHASYFIRSLALAGNSTSTPTPFNCSSYADHLDCDTDLTGADFYVVDDVEIDGELFVDGVNITLNGSLVCTEDNGLCISVGENRSVFNAYIDSTTQNISAISFVDVNLTTIKRIDEDYAYTPGEPNVTIITGGDYMISYSICLDASTGSARSTAFHRLTKDSIPIAGSSAFSYHRIAADGESCATQVLIETVNAGDEIILQSRASASGDDDMLLLANATNLYIEKISGRNIIITNVSQDEDHDWDGVGSTLTLNDTYSTVDFNNQNIIDVDALEIGVGSVAANILDLTNNNIFAVNKIIYSDAGVDEGIEFFAGNKIDATPNSDCTGNGDGNYLCLTAPDGVQVPGGNWTMGQFNFFDNGTALIID